MEHTYAATHEELADIVLGISSAGKEAYYALGRFIRHETDNGKPGRQGKYVRSLKAFWLDIDCGVEKAEAKLGYNTKKDAFLALNKFVTDCNLPLPSILIDSGGGIHAYWPLDRDVTPDEWKMVSLKLKALAAEHGFLADPSRTADVASVLRPPFTQNHKLETPRDVKIKSSTPAVIFSEFSDAINVAHAMHCGAKSKSEIPGKPGNLTLGLNLKTPPPRETPEEIERVKSMLAAIPANCDYEKWRDVVWAMASLVWNCGEKLAREWSASAPDKFDDASFQQVWDSFNPDGGIGFGTLVHYAKLHWWAGSADVQDSEKEYADTSGDIKNGQCFAKMYRGKYLFVAETGDMLEFAPDAGWIHAQPGEADRAAKKVVATLRTVAARRWRDAPDDTKNKRLMAHVERSSTEQKIHAMVSMAKSETGMTVRLSDLDADPMLLGVANGVLDLRSGKHLTVSPALLVTKRCRVPYDPEAVAPIWVGFIDRITCGKPSLAKFLQRLTGYVLTGEISEHCFAFLYGLGRNGKTTFSELLYWLMGDYATILPTATLMLNKRDPGAASPDLMLLKGMRLALASELEENARFAEAAVKSMTGGDTMTARNPYGQFASWTPTHKLLIVGNHRPVIAGGDHGIWRRVRLIPFTETIADSECDEKLPEKLQAEGAGILNWALAGLRDWQRQGLNAPAEVKAAGAAYQSDMDTLGQWMGDHVDQIPGAQIATNELYKAYGAWAKESGWSRPMTRQAFGRRLAERGILLVKGGTGHKVAQGVSLNGDGSKAAMRGGRWM